MKYFFSIVFSVILLPGLFAVVPAAVAVEAVPSEVKLDNPLTTNSTDPAVLIGLVIKSVLGFVGGLALVMMVWGGFMWLTSAGVPEKVKKGTHTMIWSIIGLVIVLGSYLLVGTVLNFLAGAGG